MSLFVGQQLLGKSHRYGLMISFEKTGVFLIIHFNHIRKWVGIGKRPGYLHHRKRYI